MKKILAILLLATCYLQPVQAQIISTICNTSQTVGYSGDGGQATAATANGIVSLAFDASGNLYFADDYNNVIRKINTAGIISTMAGRDSAGTGIAGFSGDGGQATDAELYIPYGVACDAAGNLFIGDMQNARVRKVVISTGIISTVAGNGQYGYGGDGGLAVAAKITNVYDLKFDAAGNMYLADYENNRVRKVNTAGIISTICGNGSYGHSGDGGPATAAELDEPSALAFDAAGNLYIADSYNGSIRMINTNGIISTVAGAGSCGNFYCGDGGPATDAQLNIPEGVVLDGAGNLYIADTNNDRVRMVNTAGIITTMAGNGTSADNGDGGQATAAGISGPWGMAFDAAGNLYVTSASVIRKISNAGQMGIHQVTGSSEQVTVYPNHVTNVLNVECLMINETAIVTITDMLGNSIYHSTFTTQHNTINVADLSEGVYFLRLETTEGMVIKKIIKQ